MMKRSVLKTNIKNYFLKQYNMVKKIKDELQVFSVFFFLLALQPFFILSNILILLFGTTKILPFSLPVIFSKKQHLSLTSTIFEENMLTHQASVKESICKEMLPITYIKIGVAPRQLISCQQQPHISELQKMYFTDSFNSWFCNLLL